MKTISPPQRKASVSPQDRGVDHSIESDTTRRLRALREAEAELAGAERALLLAGGRTGVLGEQLQRLVDKARLRVSDLRATWRVARPEVA